MSSLIRKDTKAAHRATWWVLAGWDNDGRQIWIRREARMRGRWPGFDVKCSCGWESHTGGAVRTSVEEDLWLHRYSAQCEVDRAREAETQADE